MKLLSSKGPLNQCNDELEVGKCYLIETSELKSTSGFTHIGHRLGEYDIYVNDVLVFALDDIIVTSSQIDGLCYLSPKNGIETESH